MPKPSINVVRINQATVPDNSNSVSVVIEDSAGLTRILNLSPEAQHQMVMACLARSPYEESGSGSSQKRELHISRLSLYESQDGMLGLQLGIGKSAALHALLSEKIKQWLLTELPVFCSKPFRKPQ